MSDDRSTLRSITAIVDQPPRVFLLVCSSDRAQVVQITPERAVVVGRTPPSDVLVLDMAVSRQHARFELLPDGVWVEDLESSNGTWVNDKRVRRGKVQPGDKIVVGPVMASLHVVVSAEETLDGIDSHDQFLTYLGHEVNQAKFFGRKLVLAMVQAVAGEHVAHWYAQVRACLRTVDRVGIYGPTALLLALPGLGYEEATTLAHRISGDQPHRGPSLLWGVALFPEAAASAQELVEVSRIATRRASPQAPVQCPAGTSATSLEVPGAPVVHSPTMHEIFATVDRLARSSIPVLIQGPTGTGKEVVARAIHERSDRRGKPMRCINCGAIPGQLLESALFGHERGAFTGADKQVRGIFEEANGGSVLLDEIGELSAAAQIALLRVLETKRICRVGSSREVSVDVRVLAATNSDVEDMCRAGKFRWDLLYRLNAMVLRIPSLFERREDIIPLANHFLREACRNEGRTIRSISPAAEELLRRYPWPGNVRELRNVIERAVVVAQGELISDQDLTDRLRAMRNVEPAGRPDRSTREVSCLTDEGMTDAPPQESDVEFRDRVRHYEIDLLLGALRETGWNQTEAARKLRMPLRTLVHKIRAYGLKPSR
jgi:DNA-binding NtrC family response regulator